MLPGKSRFPDLYQQVFLVSFPIDQKLQDMKNIVLSSDTMPDEDKAVVVEAIEELDQSVELGRKYFNEEFK